MSLVESIKNEKVVTTSRIFSLRHSGRFLSDTLLAASPELLLRREVLPAAVRSEFCRFHCYCFEDLVKATLSVADRTAGPLPRVKAEGGVIRSRASIEKRREVDCLPAGRIARGCSLKKSEKNSKDFF